MDGEEGHQYVGCLPKKLDPLHLVGFFKIKMIQPRKTRWFGWSSFHCKIGLDAESHANYTKVRTVAGLMDFRSRSAEAGAERRLLNRLNRRMASAGTV